MYRKQADRPHYPENITDPLPKELEKLRVKTILPLKTKQEINAFVVFLIAVTVFTFVSLMLSFK